MTSWFSDISVLRTVGVVGVVGEMVKKLGGERYECGTDEGSGKHE